MRWVLFQSRNVQAPEDLALSQRLRAVQEQHSRPLSTVDWQHLTHQKQATGNPREKERKERERVSGQHHRTAAAGKERCSFCFSLPGTDGRSSQKKRGEHSRNKHTQTRRSPFASDQSGLQLRSLKLQLSALISSWIGQWSAQPASRSQTQTEGCPRAGDDGCDDVMRQLLDGRSASTKPYTGIETKHRCAGGRLLLDSRYS